MTTQPNKYLFIIVLLAGCTDILVGGLRPTTDIDSDKKHASDTEPEPSDEEAPSEPVDSQTADSVTSATDRITTDTPTHTPETTDDSSNEDTESDSNDTTPPAITWCENDNSYSNYSVQCYIDSVNGIDTNSGLSAQAPVKTQDGLRSGCDVVRFKRGSVFYEALMIRSTVKVYTHYGDETEPLPRFVVPNEPMSGPVIQAMPPTEDGIIIDGLYIAGSRSDGENIADGICVVMGANTQVINSEITDCEVGAMIIGENSVFRGNYVHDMILRIIAGPDDDPNQAGGAEGIFINASNNEIAYNTFVNCHAETTDAYRSCDGGATEITVTACETIENIRIHHNYSYNSCGFIEIATYFGACKGDFNNSEIYQNISIDSEWLGFLQVNNTDFENIQFYNNTVVHHEDTNIYGRLWFIFDGTSSGFSGGELKPDTVFLTNNLFVFDQAGTFELINENFNQLTNKVIYYNEEDPGFINMNGQHWADYDLTASSPAVNAGTFISDNTLDFVHRSITDETDIGAFEYGASQEECRPTSSPL